MVSALMPAVDTAAPASLDTALSVDETQPTGTESVTPADGTDSASVGETTETVDPFAEFAPEQIEASPRIKALLEAAEKSVTARTEESHRQSLAAAAAAAEVKAANDAYQRNLKELDEVERGSVMQSLASVALAVADGDPEARTRLEARVPELRQMAEVLTRSTHTRLDRQNVDTLNAYLGDKFPDFRIAPAKVSAFDAALAKGDFAVRRTIEYDLIGEAAVEKARSTMRTEIARDLKAEAEKQMQIERTKTAETAATNRAGPTNVAGRPAQVGGPRSRKEVDIAYVAGQLTTEQRRAYYAMPLSQMPEEI